MWTPDDPQRNAEAKVAKRDAPGLYGALDALYLSPLHGFQEMADTYDQRTAGSPLYLLESTETLAALPDLTGASVLDLGCGTGRYALQAARMGAHPVIGADAVAEMLAVARRKARRAGLEGAVDWQEADLTRTLPFPEASADVVVCALTLSFLPDVGPAFAEMARVLRPGGVLVVSDAHPHVLANLRAASEADGGKDRAPYVRFTSVDGEECRIAQHVHRISTLFAAGRAAGLTLDTIAEPEVDRRLANAHASLRDKIGVPLALVLRFLKP